jgi:radical SAM protein with 4Fe4S-binding SPASM domain
MYPIINKNIFLRKTLKSSFLIVDNEFYDLEDDVIELLKLCNGYNELDWIISCFSSKYSKNEILSAINFLEKEGIIIFINNKKNEQEIDNVFIDEKYPTSINLEITYNCNMKCEHCMVDFSNKSFKELNHEDINNILSQLEEIGIDFLTITGGEPLLKKELIIDIITKARRKQLEVALLTNGYLIDSSTAQQLYNAGLNKIQISLDSTSEDKHDRIRNFPGAYRGVLNALENLKKTNIEEISLSMTITKNNFNEISSFISFCLSYNVLPRIAAVVPIGSGKSANLMLSNKQLIELYRLTHTIETNKKISSTIIPEEKCSIGSSPVITPQGDIYPCMHMKFPEFKIGNIKENRIADLWENSHIIKKLKEITRLKIEGCKDCWNKFLCNNCLGEVYSLTGKLNSINPYRCSANKEITKILINEGDKETKERASLFLDGEIY